MAKVQFLCAYGFFFFLCYIGRKENHWDFEPGCQAGGRGEAGIWLPNEPLCFCLLECVCALAGIWLQNYGSKEKLWWCGIIYLQELLLWWRRHFCGLAKREPRTLCWPRLVQLLQPLASSPIAPVSTNTLVFLWWISANHQTLPLGVLCFRSLDTSPGYNEFLSNGICCF